MSFTAKDVTGWLTVPRETEHLEFKAAREQFDTEKLLRYCVALANEGGGRLVLGVSDAPPRQVVGTRAFADPGATTSKIHNKLRIRVEAHEIDVGGKRVLVFDIPSRPRGTAYSVDGAYLMRSGEELVAMSEDRLRKIFGEGKPDWLSELAQVGLADDDVVAVLDTQSYFDLLELPYPETRSGVVDRLFRERLIARHEGMLAITNLGAILFAKRLEDVDLARKAPRVIVYDGVGKTKTKQDTRFSKGYAVAFANLVDFVNSVIPSNEVIEAALRRETKMFPTIAIRELLANALIHQDFEERGASVVVEVYSDRLAISSPGKPFIPTDRFIDEYQSRNERLADLMRRLRICEEKGSGIDKVITAVEAYQLPAPDIRATDTRTTVVLFGHKDFAAMDRSERVRACYQHCCLRYVMNEKMTNQSLRTRFELPETKAETVSRIIKDTIEEGKVKLVDPESTSKRYAKYVPFWA